MESFKEYIIQIDKKIEYLLEMARKTDLRMPIFDQDDIEYYKYIYENTPEKIRDDDSAMLSVLRQALELRYGRKSSKKPGLAAKMAEEGKDKFDYTFNVNGKKFEIKDIPMYPQKIVAKARKRGWNALHPDFGKGFGILNSPENLSGSGKQKARKYLDYLRSNNPLGEDDPAGYYDPKYDALKLDPSADALQTHEKSKATGFKKSKEYGEFDVKSMEDIHLDADDEKYLKSVEDAFLKKYPDNSAVTSAGEFNFDVDSTYQDNIKDLLARALAKRYSNHWIEKTPDGYKVKDLFSNQEDRGKLVIDLGKSSYRIGNNRIKLIDLDNIYLNLPALAKKFHKVRFARDFVDEPMTNSAGLQAAGRWLDSKAYRPKQGTRYGTMINDKDFYEQISKDHEAWRKSGGNPVRVQPVDNPELAAKLVWRDGDVVMEGPNVNDLLKRDDTKYTWDELMRDDAKRATRETIKLMASKRFNRNSGNFTAWADLQDEKMSMELRALSELTVRKTGADPNEYRKESRRLRWCNAAVERYIEEIFMNRSSGQAGKGDDAPPEPEALSRDVGQSVNTMAPSSRISNDDDSKDYIVQPTTHDEPDDYEKEVDPEYLKNLANYDQQQYAPRVPPKPPHIPLPQWLKMTPDQKIAAAGQTR